MRKLLLQQLLFFLCVVVSHAYQRLVSSAPKSKLQRFEKIDKEGVAQQRDEHGHVRTLAGSECPRGWVRHIAQRLDRRVYSCNKVRRHSALALQCA